MSNDLFEKTPILRFLGADESTMLQLAVKEAFSNPYVNQVTLGVFTNNPSAYHCYKAAGFREIEGAKQETFNLSGREWTVLEMEVVR